MTQALKDIVNHSLEELKAVEIQIIDLKGKADFADYMAGKVQDDAKAAGFPVLGVEGEDSRDWVLVDLGDIVVHLMRPETRQLYALDKLWSLPPKREE